MALFIKLNITHDKLSVEHKAPIVSGGKGYYAFDAEFDSDWVNLSKYIVFPDYDCSIAVRKQPDGTERVLVPESVLLNSGVLYFGVIGKDDNDVIRMTTNYAHIRVLEGAKETDGTPPPPNDDATWESYIGKVAQKYIDELNDSAKFPVKTADIADGAVSEAKLADKAISESKLQAGSVSSGKIQDKAISEGKLQAGSVTGAKIKDKAVSPGKLEPATVKDRVLVTSGDNRTVSWSQIYNWMIAEGTIALDRMALGKDLAEWLAVGLKKQYMPVYRCEDTDSPEGWMVNWCRDTGVYLGGFKKDCGGHPPVLNDNHTSWVLCVYGGMKTEAGANGYDHRMQIAYDVVNAVAYIRRGWISTNEWSGWVQLGKIQDGAVTEAKIADGAVTEAKLADAVQTKLNQAHTHDNKTVLDGITEEKVTEWDNKLGAIADRTVSTTKLTDDVVDMVKNPLHNKGTITSIPNFVSDVIAKSDFNPGYTWVVDSNFNYDLGSGVNINVRTGDIILAISRSKWGGEPDLAAAWRDKFIVIPHNNRVNTLEARLNSVIARVDVVEAKIRDLTEKIEELTTAIAANA